MTDETIELTRAVYELTTKIELNTQETKHQTDYLKEQFTNGFAGTIVDKITKRMAAILSLVGIIVGIIIYIV